MVLDARFFHVDRNNTLVAGVELNLVKHNNIREPGAANPLELQAHVDAMFPDGVSKHGDQYFLGAGSLAAVATPAIELLFEYVRCAHYNDRPSRMTSWFAVESVQRARAFRTQYGGQGSIWRVEAPAHFRADMNLLTLRGSVLQSSRDAHKYWQGTAGPLPQWEYLLTPPITVVELVPEDVA